MKKNNVTSTQTLLGLYIFLECFIPLLAFWYFGSTDLRLAHVLIPGERLGIIALFSSLIAYLIGSVFTVQLSLKRLHERRAIAELLLLTVVSELLIGLVADVTFREWAMIAGTHMFTSATILALLFVWVPKLKVVAKRDLTPFVTWLFTIAALLSVALFQLAAIPVGLGELVGWEAFMYLAFWFGTTIITIYRRVGSYIS